eukprot:6016685-Prorocentrum_lima.AAC.1
MRSLCVNKTNAIVCEDECERGTQVAWTPTLRTAGATAPGGDEAPASVHDLPEIGQEAEEGTTPPVTHCASPRGR